MVIYDNHAGMLIMAMMRLQLTDIPDKAAPIDESFLWKCERARVRHERFEKKSHEFLVTSINTNIKQTIGESYFFTTKTVSRSGIR